ncbi:GDSL esterase/lipase At5g42170-like [Bidens hawaiensis]|uniref:GDSL esterase/lipase At5g42170-like n=1 Tax=Bidens hawaiensis TaxID=980011 RepID=UPI004049F32E
MLLIGVKAIMLCVYASVCLCRSEGKIILQKNVSVSAVIAFGDSFVDQGNNNYINTLSKGNFLPYGMDFQGGKPTGRFSNGKTLPDLLAEALGVKDYLPASLDPFLQDKDFQTGVSFASGGSGFDPLTTTISAAIPMLVQLDMFKQYIGKLKTKIEEEAANNIINNSVVVIVAGTNDMLLSFPIRRLQYDAPSYANMIVNLLLNFIKEIYNLGVRKIVVFNVVPVGCLPTMRTLAGGLERRCGDNVNNATQLFNNILKQQLQFWATSYPESRVAVIDYYKALINIIENPHKYGFDVTDKGCCGTGELETAYLCNKLASTCPKRSKYIFWDALHLTEKGSNIMVNHILHDLVNILF